MNRSVILKITYDTDEATKQGIINVAAECSGAIRRIEELNNPTSILNALTRKQSQELLMAAAIIADPLSQELLQKAIEKKQPELSCSYYNKICSFRNQRIEDIARKKDWKKCGDCEYLDHWEVE